MEINDTLEALENAVNDRNEIIDRQKQLISLLRDYYDITASPEMDNKLRRVRIRVDAMWYKLAKLTKRRVGESKCPLTENNLRVVTGQESRKSKLGEWVTKNFSKHLEYKLNHEQAKLRIALSLLYLMSPQDMSDLTSLPLEEVEARLRNL